MVMRIRQVARRKETTGITGSSDRRTNGYGVIGVDATTVGRRNVCDLQKQKIWKHGRDRRGIKGRKWIDATIVMQHGLETIADATTGLEHVAYDAAS